MRYTVRVSPHAQRSVNGLFGKVRAMVEKAIDHLADDPRPPGCLKMKGRANQWRVRAGEYRIVYTIDDTNRLVRVIEVGHRRDVYKD